MAHDRRVARSSSQPYAFGNIIEVGFCYEYFFILVTFLILAGTLSNSDGLQYSRRDKGQLLLISIRLKIIIINDTAVISF